MTTTDQTAEPAPRRWPTPGTARTGAGALGVGAAACAARCAGPILGALSAIGLASAAGYFLAGLVAIVVGVAAVAAVVLRRRRRADACTPGSTDTVTFGPRTGPGVPRVGNVSGAVPRSG